MGIRSPAERTCSRERRNTSADLAKRSRVSGDRVSSSPFSQLHQALPLLPAEDPACLRPSDRQAQAGLDRQSVFLIATWSACPGWSFTALGRVRCPARREIRSLHASRFIPRLWEHREHRWEHRREHPVRRHACGEYVPAVVSILISGFNPLQCRRVPRQRWSPPRIELLIRLL